MMRILSISALLFALMAPVAQGALFLGFGVNGSDPIATNEVNAFVNDILTINVYLVENDIPTVDTRLEDNGVLQFDFVAEYQNTFGNVTSVNASSDFPILQINDINAAGFPTPNFRMAGLEASLLNGVEPNPGERFVELGTYMFQVTSAGITEFVFNDPDPSPGNDSNGLGDPSFEIIDAEIFPNPGPLPTFRVVSATAIPEPSSFLAIACLFGVGALHLRRRRRVKVGASDGGR